MSELKRFDMNGTPHVNGHYCNAQQVADLIEQQQARIAELEATVERLREAYFSQREHLKGTIGTLRGQLNECESNQNLNAIKREAFIEGFNAGFSDYWIVDEEEHAEVAVEVANQRYSSDKDGE